MCVALQHSMHVRSLQREFTIQLLRSLGVPAAVLVASGCCYDADSTECLPPDEDGMTCPTAEEARAELGVDTVREGPTFWPAREYVVQGETVRDAAECCYEVTSEVCSEFRGMGRAYLDAGGHVTAPARRRAEGDPWAGTRLRPAIDGLTTDERTRLAAAWTERGLAEHASIASLGRFALDLLALDAPPELVAAAHRAASDEVRHARLCFGLASAYAGAAVGPGVFPFADRAVALSPDLASFARRCALEGCVEETLGVVELAERLAVTTDPAVATVLAALIRDERRHAELAWRALRWAVATGGDAVRDALRGAFDRPPPLASTRPAIEAHGELSSDRLHTITDVTHRAIVLPCARAALARVA